MIFREEGGIGVEQAILYTKMFAIVWSLSHDRHKLPTPGASFEIQDGVKDGRRFF